MADDTKLVAMTRQDSGSGAARRLRNAGLLPCVMYGEGHEPKMLQTDLHDFNVILQHHHGESMMLDVEIDGGKTIKVLLKEVQHDSLTDGPVHADLFAVSMTRKLRVSIPVDLTGEAVGVLQGDGVQDHLIREIEVECLPSDIVDSITADVSGLDVGQYLLVRDLDVPETITVLTDGDIAVVGILAPTLKDEDDEETGEEGEGEEGAAAAEGDDAVGDAEKEG